MTKKKKISWKGMQMQMWICDSAYCINWNTSRICWIFVNEFEQFICHNALGQIKLTKKILWKCLLPPKPEVWTLFPKFFTANILFWEHLGVISYKNFIVKHWKIKVPTLFHLIKFKKAYNVCRHRVYSTTCQASAQRARWFLLWAIRLEQGSFSITLKRG